TDDPPAGGPDCDPLFGAAGTTRMSCSRGEHQEQDCGAQRSGRSEQRSYGLHLRQ
ncbi:hypothetical protein M9458_051728, partial [Cirrhinus mrigala]